MREPAVLLTVALAGLVVSGTGAHDIGTWLLEVTPIAIAVPVLAATFSRFRFTVLAYRLMTAGALMMELGAHYTYAHVPLGFWMQDWFGFARNHYDRLGHIMQGVVAAIVLRELLLRHTGLRPGRWLWLVLTAGCLGISAGFELIEAAAATVSGQGGAYLATQGDPMDTQWDMLMALLGALTCQALLSRAHDRQLQESRV
ncbi:DUF2238 domain-containing protein [Amycolatopsis aidingensis]|uniref:DUF2238 domain-containing protein n=1 Tax=Amycolatopsis aidingensis TaxID=2842453 RepID=UPI001C0E752B|nr:DUF2238 domain-containing protein [Amycolatopsis aidingensis]